MNPKKGKLSRLPRSVYCGVAHIHWVLTIERPGIGWLSSSFHHQFREVLIHTAFRYGLLCPIYCLMPDHIHLLWVGLDEKTDQFVASKYFRKSIGLLLKRVGFQFQHQPFDRVLRKEEQGTEEFRKIANYIANNPVRKGLVPASDFLDYEFLGCVLPGYPEIEIKQGDYWNRFWRILSFLRENGLRRISTEK